MITIKQIADIRLLSFISLNIPLANTRKKYLKQFFINLLNQLTDKLFNNTRISHQHICLLGVSTGKYSNVHNSQFFFQNVHIQIQSKKILKQPIGIVHF